MLPDSDVPRSTESGSIDQPPTKAQIYNESHRNALLIMGAFAHQELIKFDRCNDDQEMQFNEGVRIIETILYNCYSNRKRPTDYMQLPFDLLD